jgi:hypothetical protein
MRTHALSASLGHPGRKLHAQGFAGGRHEAWQQGPPGRKQPVAPPRGRLPTDNSACRLLGLIPAPTAHQDRGPEPDDDRQPPRRRAPQFLGGDQILLPGLNPLQKCEDFGGQIQPICVTVDDAGFSPVNAPTGQGVDCVQGQRAITLPSTLTLTSSAGNGDPGFLVPMWYDLSQPATGYYAGLFQNEYFVRTSTPYTWQTQDLLPDRYDAWAGMPGGHGAILTVILASGGFYDGEVYNYPVWNS